MANAVPTPDAAMTTRRSFVTGLMALPAFPVCAADEVRFTVTGAMEQGSLALGHAPPGSRVALDGRPLRVTPAGRFVFVSFTERAKAAFLPLRRRVEIVRPLGAAFGDDDPAANDRVLAKIRHG